MKVQYLNKAIKDFERERIIGEITVYIPEPPKDYKLIANWDLPQSKQKFYYTEQPAKNKEPTNVFLKQEFERFQNGYWFFNNGKLEWLTPFHYFFLNYWTDKGKRMYFIDSQREASIWFWQIERMDNMMGGNLITNRRFGKALDVNTPIPTPDGWKTMLDLKEGDRVFDSKGKVVNVIAATGIQYDRVCYDVKFSDGSSIIADAEHQWIAYKKESRACLHKHPSWAHPDVVTTEQIKNRLRVNKNKEVCWSILNTKPVEYDKKELLIEPYILGVWLGDGASRHPSLTSIDDEIIHAWKDYAERNDLKFTVSYQNDRCNLYRITGKKGAGNQHTNHFLNNLQKYDLILNKHIPIDYLQSDAHDRLELLKGLMDTDGCVYSGGNCFEYCSKYKHLAEQLKELAESLGFKCVLAYKVNNKYGTTFWYVRFGSTDVAPFKLQRKLDKIKIGKRNGGIRYDHRYIIDVVPVESRPVKCISVDSEDQSYLCANYIVTHNTVWGTALAYFRSSTNPFHRAGIQSKTNADAKLVFGKLIKSWQKLPNWLKPIDSGETRPATTLEFSEPRTRSTNREKKVYEDVLESSIDFRSSEEDSYDGDELHTYYEDEFGKVSPPINTDTRWGVVQYCLLIGSTIVGKALRTTTVEEMERKGGKNAKKTWDDSMIKTMNEATGRTDSMLTNLFIPADYGLKGIHPKTKEPFVDEYGISNRELARQYILSSWENLTEDKLKAAQRKNPLNLKHAFQLANNTGTFDAEIYDYLDIQKDYLNGTSVTGENAPKNLRRNVTFFREADDSISWRHDDNGKSSIVWDFPQRNMTNARRVGDSQLFVPLNTEEFVGGCDPFAATITVGPGSMGVLYIYRKGTVEDPENSGMVICRYSQRTRMVEDFHKNVMMICQYYGCKVNYESDVPDFYETFLRHRYKNYIMWTPKIAIDPTKRNHTLKPGTASKDPFAFQKQFQVLVEYLLARWHKIYFIELIEQLIEFDVEDRTKSDDVIAFSMSLLGGWQGGTSTVKDTRSTNFIKFKNSDKYFPNNKSGGFIDLSQYHLPSKN